jgi:hypothetical protein
VKASASRKVLKRHQATSGRGVLAGAESGCRVDRNADRASRCTIAVMRAVHKKSADPQRGKGELVLRQPVAGRQLFFTDFDKATCCRSGRESELRRERGRQYR